MKKIIIIVLLVCFVNIAVAPVLAINEVQPTKTFQYKVKKEKKYDGSYRYGYVNTDWWKTFNDENLNNYIKMAIENNYDLKIAGLNVKEFYQYTKVQFANELPQATIGFSPAYTKMPQAASENWVFAVPAVINYEADIFLKNRDKTKSQKKMWESSVFDERATYISIASAVGTTYFNLVKINEVIALQEKIVKSRKEIYELMLQCNKEGLISTSDTVKANKAYVYGTSDLIDLKKNKIKLLNQLAVLIGESPENINRFKISPIENINYSAKLPSEISTEVITARPDYLKSEKMLEKYGIDVRIAKKEFLPNINLTGLVLFNASNLGSTFTTGNALWALAAGAMLPVFTGGQRFANLKIKKIQYDKALESYYKTNLVAIQEVNDAMVAVKHDKDKLKEHIKQKNLETIDFNYTKDKYKSGIISKLDLIQMEENLLTVNKLVINSQTDCYIDYIGLYKAVGSKL